MKPTNSDGDTILPESVAPPSAINENSPSWTLGDSEKVKGVSASYAHEELTSLLFSITNFTAVSVPFRVKPLHVPFTSKDSWGAYVYRPSRRCDCPSGLITTRSTAPIVCAGASV